MEPTTQPHRPPSASPSPQLRVAIATATAMIFDRARPWLILVADSQKHAGPVMPGGKIEAGDLLDGENMAQAALRCIRRELAEEVNLATDQPPKPLFVRGGPSRDIRYVPAQKLRGCLGLDPQLPHDDHQIVEAHYGEPDHVFGVAIDRSQVAASEELQNLRFIDIRSTEARHLGGGHSEIVERYLRTLQS